MFLDNKNSFVRLDFEYGPKLSRYGICLDCYLDRDPEVVPVYTGHSLFNTTKRITLFFIVQPMLHRNPDNIGIKVI